MTAVFEVIENKRQQIFVGLTELSLEQELARLKGSTAACFKGWDWESVMVRPVEAFECPKLAKAFFERYAAKTPPPGWVVLTG